MFQDSRGVIWLGGKGTGLYRVIADDMNRFQFKHYGPAEGFDEKTVYGVTEDELGNIWIATENGLSRLLVNSGTFIAYGKSDGLLDKGYDANALYFSQQYNRLYCGKDHGLYQVQLRKPAGLMGSHGVKVSFVRINEGSWMYAEKKSLSGLEEGDQLELALTSQGYGYGSSVRIRYKSEEAENGQNCCLRIQ